MIDLSIFTPAHRTEWLNELWISLLEQSFKNWEWIVLLNGGATWEPPPDPRVRVYTYPYTPTEKIGELKSFAVCLCQGEVLVEVDCDDILLTSNLLGEVYDGLHYNPTHTLAYSNFTQLNADLTPNYDRFREDHGWVYQDVHVVEGIYQNTYLSPLLMAPTPHNISHIWYAPNHIRAFPRWAYNEVGGYNVDLDILDDQDLICRLYQLGDFIKVGGLYGQRIHEGNTQRNPERNARIQSFTLELYNKYISHSVVAWAGRNNLRALELGGGNNVLEGFQNVDMYPPADYVHTFPASLTDIPDNSVGVVRCVDFLEHVRDQRAMMDEIWRMLAPNGMLLSLTPSTDGRGAFQDPSHVSFWNENSFWYYTQDEMSHHSPQNRDTQARFQVSSLKTYFPTQWHADHNIPYVQSNLIAVKYGYLREGGILQVGYEDMERRYE